MEYDPLMIFHASCWAFTSNFSIIPYMNHGLMVVKWWLNGGLMVVKWWFNHPTKWWF